MYMYGTYIDLYVCIYVYVYVCLCLFFGCMYIYRFLLARLLIHRQSPVSDMYIMQHTYA